jgi:hypothetical protein
MLNRRQVHGDMNRKFVPRENPSDPEGEVVKLLKNLMKEADVFINQHDAYGFHRERYISETYNQFRYGQSLIIDSGNFYSQKLKRQINLSETGKRILKRVNRQIENEAHHFGFWDHNSVDKNTRHLAMRKSATYYALTTFSIPAFGLETSKDLPTLYHKVKYQLLVIKEILREFDLEFVFPPLRVREPVLYWAEFLKNGKDIIRVNGNTNLRLNPADKIVIKRIFSNYDSGHSANILDWGTLNDISKELIFKKNTTTTIIIKKNHLVIGKVYLRGFRRDSVREITVDVNGGVRKIPNWGKIELKDGQYFNIRGVVPSFSGVRFDVRGFGLPPGKPDDSNVNIYPANLIKKYSFKKKNNIYFVKIYTAGRFAGGFQVEII